MPQQTSSVNLQHDITKVLERKLRVMEAEAAEKEQLIEALFSDMFATRNRYFKLLDSLAPQDRMRIEDAAVFGSRETLIARSAGRLRSPLESHAMGLRDFDGTNGMQLSIEQSVPLPYTIKARFRNVRSASERYSFSETSPAMPLVVGKLAIYLTDPQTVRFFVGEAENSTYCEVWDDGNWIDICMTVTEAGGSLLVDGHEELVFDEKLAGEIDEVFIGCGHLDRQWSGQIAALSIVKGVWDPNDVNLPEDRVRFNYNGEKVTQT